MWGTLHFFALLGTLALVAELKLQRVWILGFEGGLIVLTWTRGIACHTIGARLALITLDFPSPAICTHDDRSLSPTFCQPRGVFGHVVLVSDFLCYCVEEKKMNLTDKAVARNANKALCSVSIRMT